MCGSRSPRDTSRSWSRSRLFGGGGFFAVGVSANGLESVEASLEFGGNISLNLGVASGGVYVMAGIYFGMKGKSIELTGYLRCGGYLSVLGLISISLEFYLAFTYRKKDPGGSEVWGQASLTVSVKVAFFSTSVTLSVERRFAGSDGDPSFADTVDPASGRVTCRPSHDPPPERPVDPAAGRADPGRPARRLGVRGAAAAPGRDRRPWPTSPTSPTGPRALAELELAVVRPDGAERGAAGDVGVGVQRALGRAVPRRPPRSGRSSSTTWPTGRWSATPSAEVLGHLRNRWADLAFRARDELPVTSRHASPIGGPPTEPGDRPYTLADHFAPCARSASAASSRGSRTRADFSAACAPEIGRRSRGRPGRCAPSTTPPCSR